MAAVLITGCSGGGKSTLLEELARRGHRTVREPGRRLIAQGITPWDDRVGFLHAAVAMARADLAALLPELGYRPHELPRAGVAERADFVLAALETG